MLNTSSISGLGVDTSLTYLTSDPIAFHRGGTGMPSSLKPLQANLGLALRQGLRPPKCLWISEMDVKSEDTYHLEKFGIPITKHVTTQMSTVVNIELQELRIKEVHGIVAMEDT